MVMSPLRQEANQDLEIENTAATKINGDKNVFEHFICYG